MKILDVNQTLDRNDRKYRVQVAHVTNSGSGEKQKPSCFSFPCQSH